MKKIYCWVNSGAGTEWQHVMAMCEDGEVLAGHLSSNRTWAMHDIGITSDWKHDLYQEHCPDGYELEWIDHNDVNTHVGLEAAYQLNQKLAKEAEATA